MNEEYGRIIITRQGELFKIAFGEDSQPFRAGQEFQVLCFLAGHLQVASIPYVVMRPTVSAEGIPLFEYLTPVVNGLLSLQEARLKDPIDINFKKRVTLEVASHAESIYSSSVLCHAIEGDRRSKKISMTSSCNQSVWDNLVGLLGFMKIRLLYCDDVSFDGDLLKSNEHLCRLIMHIAGINNIGMTHC